jgi:hypothetical protein
VSVSTRCAKICSTCEVRRVEGVGCWRTVVGRCWCCVVEVLVRWQAQKQRKLESRREESTLVESASTSLDPTPR